MAWDRWHQVNHASGEGLTITPGYLSETIGLKNNADSSTSYLPVSTKSDATILAVFSRDITVDTYIQIEHSVDGQAWVKMGVFEEDNSVDHDDISKNMAKIAALDVSIMGTLTGGCMMLYDIDTHGAAPYTRFTVKANGTDESDTECTFYFIPHF